MMTNDEALLSFKNTANYDDRDPSESDFIEECKRQLVEYRDSNTPITDPTILSTLHDLFMGDDEEITLFRGLLFNNKEQTERFNDSINESTLSQGLPVALTASKSIASEFATTQKTYDDMDLARQFAEKRKKGEVITGYEGVVLTLKINAKYCIDLSKAGMSSEAEFLMLPNITAPIINDERKIPFSRMFESGQLTIDSVVNDTSDESASALNYVLINFPEQLTKSQISSLCDRYNKKSKEQYDTENAEFLAGYSGILDAAKSTNKVQYIKKTEHKPLDRKERDFGVFVHPSNIVLREWNTTEYVNHKHVDKVVLCADTNLSYSVIDLAKRGLLYKEQLDELEDSCNSICAAITDATKHEAYRATELEHYTFELLRDFASPLALSVMSNAMAQKRKADIAILNDTKSVTTKNDLREHAELVKNVMTNFIKNVASGRPSENRPKPRF